MPLSPLRWDLFCHVIDNYGDVGVSWRVARRLAELGDEVRLWIDDPSALTFMAPQGHPGVTLVAWQDPLPELDPGDVVVEAFGCNPPAAFVQRMAQRATPAVWINLEYFTAEPQAERNHGLPSPQHNGLTKWFFYPGLSTRTGGLVRESTGSRRRAQFDRVAWLRAMGVPYRAGDRVVSLFCYDNPRLPTWWAWLAQHHPRTHLLVTPGPAAQQAQQLATLPSLSVHPLPWLTQEGYDELLWACDLNFVRGEDSVVRGLLAGQPLLWQIYPQEDNAHAVKLEAFLRWYLACAPQTLATSLAPVMRHWAGTLAGPEVSSPPCPPLPLPLARDQAAWAAHAQGVSAQIAALPELGQSLREFVHQRRR